MVVCFSMFVTAALHFSGFCFAIVMGFGELLWWQICDWSGGRFVTGVVASVLPLL